MKLGIEKNKQLGESTLRCSYDVYCGGNVSDFGFHFYFFRISLHFLYNLFCVF